MNKSYAFIAIDSLSWEILIFGFFLQFFSCLSAYTNSFSQNVQGVFSFIVVLDFVVLAFDFVFAFTSTSTSISSDWVFATALASI